MPRTGKPLKEADKANRIQARATRLTPDVVREAERLLARLALRAMLADRAAAVQPCERGDGQ